MAKGQGRAVKNPKRHKEEEQEEEEIEDLEELLEDPRKRRRKTPSLYAAMETGQFVMKGKDRKERLDRRHKKIVAAAGKPDDDDDDNDDDDEEELEKQRLECETK